MRSELQEQELVISCSKIDFGLLVKQQKEINLMRSRIPSSHSKNYQILTGILHLHDYLDAIGNLVLIQDYATYRQYFVANGLYCRNYADSEVYDQVIQTRKIASESSVIGCPSKSFSNADWENFRKYGLNESFELN